MSAQVVDLFTRQSLATEQPAEPDVEDEGGPAPLVETFMEEHYSGIALALEDVTLALTAEEYRVRLAHLNDLVARAPT